MDKKWLICALAWLVPGGGHLIQKHRDKGLVFLVVIPLMFGIGLWLSGRLFPLEWNDPLGATQSFVLIADDPDAPVGTWVHWVLFDLPANARTLGQNAPKKEQMADGSRQGRNDFGKIGYGGPCPPPGKPHRYFFKLYALDTKLNLKPGATKKDVEHAMQGHVLAQGEWMGRYSR